MNRQPKNLLITMDRTYPLSPSQENVWLANRFAPASPVYNVPLAFRLSGHLDIPLLERAFAKIIHRHTALRTRIVVKDGQPSQQVQDEVRFQIQVFDASAAPDERRDFVIQQRVREAICCPMDLEKDLPIRVMLIRQDENRHYLAIVLHHLVSDHWSLKILCSELNAFYMEGTGQAFVSCEQTTNFARFAAEQRRRIDTRDGDEQMAFWLDHLQGHAGAASFAIDEVLPAATAGDPFRGSRELFEISPQLEQRLQVLSRNAGASLFMTLLAAFKVLLYRYSQTKDITIGVPVGQRIDPELENTIGFLVNTLPMRTVLADELSFDALLRRIRIATLAMVENPEVSLNRLAQALNLPRREAKNPFYATVFQHLTFPAPVLSLPELNVESLPVHTETSKFDLILTLRNGTHGLEGEVEFSTSAFPRNEVIKELISHYITLLESIAQSPQESISRLAILSIDERKRILEEFNSTETNYPRESGIPQLFREQVRATPDAVAAVFENTHVSYSDLDRRSSGIARDLLRRGVQSGDRVAVFAPRSIETVTALLGILKAGCAYVPLEPDYPGERISLILNDAGVRLAVTTTHLVKQLPPHVEPLLLDSEAAHSPPLDSEPPDDPALDNFLKTDGDSIAYVIYTSGTMGYPKGVAVRHRGVVRLVKNTDYASFGPEETFLQLAPLAFDASTFEIWGPLLNGGRLAIFPPEFKSLSQLEKVIRDQKITTLWLTAGLFNQVVDENVAALHPLKQLLTGGDILSVPHVRKALRHLPDCQLINGYGPTENTTFTCCFRLPKDWPGGKSVPIGRPIKNTRVYILDANLEPVPIGIPGELYIGGDGLAAEYINNPELTAAKFIPAPSFASGSKRLYKTGDMACWTKDGEIEFIGRNDDQVKIRGFRVEPAEVENAIRNLDIIKDCSIVVEQNTAGTKSLTACVVWNHPGTTTAELTCRLKNILPSFMVPGRIVVLDRMPTTPNGKTDRRALKDLAASARPQESPIVEATLDPQEAQIRDIWKAVLGCDSIGKESNFFHIGGDSLLAIKVISRINDAFKTSLSLAALFRAPSIASLAEYVRSQTPGDEADRIMPRRAGKSISMESLRNMDEQQIDALLREAAVTSERKTKLL